MFVLLVTVPSAVFANAPAPMMLKPTNKAPPVLTNSRRYSVAPKALPNFSLQIVFSLEIFIVGYLPFAMTVAARCTASMIAV